MPKVPDLVGRLRMDTRDLDRARGQVAAFSRSLDAAGEGSRLGSTLGNLDRALGKLDQRTSRVGENLTDFGKRASVATSLPIAAGFGLATKAASDLSEQVNKTSVVFGDASDEVIAFSENSAKSLGQSQRAALEAAGTYGNLFAAIGLTTSQSAEMSKTLLTLGADLASFNNANPEDVFLALRSGLTGESEPLKKFGVNLNETTLKAKALQLGLSNGVSVLSANAKAQAAYALILEQTSTAQGDFARTSGGLANQTRILKAELENAGAEMGSHLIPIALKLTSVTSGLLGAFDDMPAAAQNLALIGLAATASVGPLSFLAGNALKIKAATTAATAAIGGQSFGAGVAAASATKLAGGLLKVGAAGVGLYAVVQGLQAIGGSASDATVNMDKLVQASGEELVAAFQKALAFDPASADKVFATILKSSTSEAQRVVDALAAAGAETGKYQQAIDKAVDADGRSVIAKEKDAAATDKAAAALRGSTAAIGENVSRTADFEDVNRRLVTVITDVNKATDDRRQAVLSVIDAEAANRRAVTWFSDAVADVADKERDLADARRGRTAASRDAISVERALNGVEDAQSSIVDQERALADARAGRGQKARELADAEKELRRAREEAAGAHGVTAARKAGEGVADAEERVNRAREDGGQAEDIRAATEGLSRAQLDAREAALNLADAREAGANRVKAAEDALALAQQTAADRAVDQAHTFQDLAEQRAKALGIPLSVAESYNVFRNKLIEIKDTSEGPVKTALEGVINLVGELPGISKPALLAITADTSGAVSAITSLQGLISAVRADAANITAQLGTVPTLVAPRVPTATVAALNGGTAPRPSSTQNNYTTITGVREADVAVEVNRTTARNTARAR